MTTSRVNGDAEVERGVQEAVDTSAEREHGVDRSAEEGLFRSRSARLLQALRTRLRDPQTRPLGPTWKKCASALAISLLAAATSRGLAHSSFDRYPDLVVGDSVLTGDLIKTWDYAFLNGMLAGFAVWLIACVIVGACLSLSRGRRDEERLDTILAACALPAVYVVAQVLMGRTPDLRADRVTELTLVACLSAHALIVAACAAMRRPAMAADRSGQYGTLLACSTLIPLFAAISASAVAIAYARIFPYAEQAASEDALTRLAAISFVCGSIIVAATWLVAGVRQRALRVAVSYELVLSQLALPFGFCALVPPHVIDDGRIEHMFDWTAAFVLFLIALTLISCIWMLASFRRALRAKRLRLDSLISTPAVAAILLLVMPAAEQLHGTDDYHLGERLVTAFLTADHGMLPFIDYVPPHGLVDPLGVLVGRLFFEDSVDVIAPGILILNSLLILAALAVLRTQIGIGLAALIVYAMVADHYMWLHASSSLALIIAVSGTIGLLLSRRYLTLAIGYLALGPVLAIYSIPQGIAAAMLIFPFAAYAGWRALRQDRHRTLVRGGVAAVALAVAWLVTPFGQMVLSAAEYLLIQRALNDVAWGSRWESSPVATVNGVSTTVFEAIRWSFLGVFAVAFGVVLRSLVSKASGKSMSAQATSYGIAAMLLILLLIPYAAGRIGFDAFNKTGWLTLVAVCYFLPCILLGFSRRRMLEIAALVLLFASFVAEPSPVESWSANPSSIVALPPVEERAGTAAMPRTGRSELVPRQRRGLRQLSEAIELFVDDDETFLEASNSNAFYYYLDRPTPLRNMALLNSHAASDQLESIARLEQEPAPLLVAQSGGAAINTPSVPLRTPLLFRYMLERYVPIPMRARGHVYGVLPERLERYKRQLLDNPEKGADRDYFVAADRDDQYWTDGILVALEEASVLVPVDSPNTLLLQPGRRVKVTQGDARTITKVEPVPPFIRVTFNGAKLDPEQCGYPHRMYFGNIVWASAKERVTGWDEAWLVRDVGMTPTAWGRSFSSLQPLLVEKGNLGASTGRQLRSLAQVGDEVDRLVVEGDAPRCSWVFDEPMNGREVGILGLDLRFESSDGTPLDEPVACKVGWRHSGAPDPLDGFALQAGFEKILVPLDASHRWVLRDQIVELWIEFEGLPVGASIEMKNPLLYQRRAVDDLKLVDRVKDWYDR